MHTSFYWPALTLALAITAHADEVTPLLLNRLIQEAVMTHPSIEAAQARTQAATSAIGAVRLWQDPQLGLGTLFGSRMSRQNRGDIMVGINQMLPRPKLYQAEKRRAVEDQLTQVESRRQTANELALSVAQATLELALADEVVRLQAENVGWLQMLVKTAEERSKNPNASVTEPLRLESELAVQIQMLESARRMRTQYSKVRLERDNPQLAAMRHQIAGAQADADAAREKRKPAFSVGVQVNTYSQGNSNDTMTMLTVGMTLPWFNRSVYKADIARAESQRSAAQSDLAAEQRALHIKLTALLTEEENNRRLADAYTNEVLPKTEKTVETLENAWVSSRATLLDVLDARRSLLQARLEQQRARASQHVASQALTALTGNLVPASRNSLP
ncbi:MAG: hypothetical protein B7Z37_28135 [Verrucomicrobia bacterium 12-59-8]|nr:MAG: hypothetical protein B7Z37_28135 [Verrucomicrobia bacterium 12-59-8]